MRNIFLIFYSYTPNLNKCLGVYGTSCANTVFLMTNTGTNILGYGHNGNDYGYTTYLGGITYSGAKLFHQAYLSSTLNLYIGGANLIGNTSYPYKVGVIMSTDPTYSTLSFDNSTINNNETLSIVTTIYSTATIPVLSGTYTIDELAIVSYAFTHNEPQIPRVYTIASTPQSYNYTLNGTVENHPLPVFTITNFACNDTVVNGTVNASTLPSFATFHPGN
jgi:hypothetical protein